jgi:hypothetical protein
MNAAHFHLLVNHLPLLATLMGALLLILGITRWFADGMRQAGLILIVIAGLASLTATISGEGAAEVMENQSGIARADIHNHEEAAETANVVAIITALLSMLILALEFSGRTVMKWLWALLVLALLSTAGLMANTARLGGHIHHPETTRGWQVETGSLDLEEEEAVPH